MHSDYLNQAFSVSRREEAVERVVTLLRKPKFEKVDCLALRGLSGLIIGSIAAHRTGKKLAVIRKPNDDSHGDWNLVEASHLVTNWLFVDDFLSSGKTLFWTKTAMEAAFPKAKCAGAFVYNGSGRFYSPKQIKVELDNYVDCSGQAVAAIKTACAKIENRQSL